MRRFFRAIYYVGVILVFLLVAAAGVTQTRGFKSWLRDFLLQHAGSVIRGELTLGRIDGNLVTGFRVNGVGIRLDGIDVVTAERLDVTYDPLSLPFNRIALSRATLIHPTVRLIRSMDGRWNIARVLIPAEPDTTPSRTTIQLKLVELIGGRISIIDSLRKAQRTAEGDTTVTGDRVDYAHVELDSVQLAASADIAPHSYAAQIRALSFVSRTPAFTLRKLRFDAVLNRRTAQVTNLQIETNRSHLTGHVALRDVDVTTLKSLADLGTRPVDVELTATPLATGELRQFVYPWIDFLDREFDLSCRIGGTFGNMRMQELALRMGETHLRLEGTLQHLDHPSDLTMDLTSSRSQVHPADLATYLPGLHIPDLTMLGDVMFDLRYEGRPTDFHATIDASSQVGDVSAGGTLRIDNGLLIYDWLAQGREVDLAPITGQDRLESRMNAQLKMTGQGVDPRSMTTVARLEIDSSVVANLPVHRTVLVVDAADGVIRTHSVINAGSTTANLSGTMRLHGGSLAYDFETQVNALNLADVLDGDSEDSDLSFLLQGHGNGRGPVRQDSLRLRLDRSRYGDESFAGGIATMAFHSADSTHQTLRLRSDVCDADVDGHFSIPSLTGFLPNGVRLAVDALTHRIGSLDTLGVRDSLTRSAVPFVTSVSDVEGRIDARFSVALKDFHPLGAVLATPMEGEGTVRGTVRGSNDNLSITGVATVPTLSYGDEPLAANEASAEFSFDGLNRRTVDRTLHGRVQATAREFSIGENVFAGPMVECTLFPDSLEFAAGTLIDSLVLVQMSGSGVFRNRLLDIRLDEFTGTVGDLPFSSSDPLHVQVGRNGIAIDHWNLEQEAEELTVDGTFIPGGRSDLSVGIRGLLLADLSQALRRTDLKDSFKSYAGIVRADGTFRGTFEDPELSLDLLAEGVRAQETVFGRMSGSASYAAHVLTLNVRLESRPDRPGAAPDLLLSGTVPYDLAFIKTPSRDVRGDIDLTLQSKGLNMSFLNPFVPEISGLSGTLVCDMRMRGAVGSPQYEGSLNIRGARFFFRPVGIWYQLDGNLLAAGDRINLQNVVIRNTQEDQPDGAMDVGGALTLFGLSFREFDLLANGQLLVMKEESRQPGQKFYGRLLVASGAGGLHWKGNFRQSSLSGALAVKRAQLTFPPERETEVVRTRQIGVIFVDDTVHARHAAAQDSSRRRRNGKPTATGVALAPQQTDSRSFVDRINYDISLETQGPTQLRMVFNTQTSEELFADLQGQLYFFKTPDVTRLTGTVEVSNRSYYQFIKKFQVSQGKLQFTGDPLNPELNITAEYSGIHRKQVADTNSTIPNASKEEKVTVILTITGTRSEPKPQFSLDIDGTKRQTGDEESDAISFILSGQFRNELTDQQRTGLLGTNLGIGLASGMLTGPLSDLLRRETGVIQSVDVLYYGGGTFDQSTDLRLTGQVGDAVIRLGGRVLSDINNTNASVELPMSSITGSQGLRNLILTLERRVEGVDYLDERRRASNGARIYYRIAF